MLSRLEERKGYPEFYKRHILNIKKNRSCCQECGVRLLGHVSEVAHILGKSKFKSVSTIDENIIYLCGYLQENCHGSFDNISNEGLKKMNIYDEVVLRFKYLINFISEDINYKIKDRYGC